MILGIRRGISTGTGTITSAVVSTNMLAVVFVL
jgi:hypothetical protein